MLRNVTPDSEAPTMPKATTAHGARWLATKNVAFAEVSGNERFDERCAMASKTAT